MFVSLAPSRETVNCGHHSRRFFWVLECLPICLSVGNQPVHGSA